MKMLVSLLIVLILPAATFAADFAYDKGSIILGGSVSSSMTKARYVESGRESRMYDNDQVFVNPEIGYFIFKGFVIGPAVEFSLNNFKARFREQNITSQGYGLKGKYYLGKKGWLVSPYLGCAYLMTTMTTSYPGTSEITYKGNKIVPVAGLSFMLSEKVALGLELDYPLHNYEVTAYSDYLGNSLNDYKYKYKESQLNIALAISTFIF